MPISVEELKERVKLVQAMDTVISFMDHEGAEERWLMMGPGDGASQDDYIALAEDEECMEYAVRCFADTISEFGRFGWSAGDKGFGAAREQACPECGERADIEGEMPIIEGRYAWQSIRCCKCGSSYREVYRFAFTE